MFGILLKWTKAVKVHSLPHTERHTQAQMSTKTNSQATKFDVQAVKCTHPCTKVHTPKDTQLRRHTRAHHTTHTQMLQCTQTHTLLTRVNASLVAGWYGTACTTHGSAMMLNVLQVNSESKKGKGSTEESGTVQHSSRVLYNSGS